MGHYCKSKFLLGFKSNCKLTRILFQAIILFFDEMNNIYPGFACDSKAVREFCLIPTVRDQLFSPWGVVLRHFVVVTPHFLT